MEPNTRHEGHSTVLSPGYSNHENPVRDVSSRERIDIRTGNKGLHAVFGALGRGWSHG
ncbi:MAG: hypothetical protein WBA22_06730 [Candidatus Methanofastidiosia archaeon]